MLFPSFRTEICIAIQFAANRTTIRTGDRLRVDGPRLVKKYVRFLGRGRRCRKRQKVVIPQSLSEETQNMKQAYTFFLSIVSFLVFLCLIRISALLG
jgi:hypothetical protein